MESATKKEIRTRERASMTECEREPRLTAGGVLVTYPFWILAHLDIVHLRHGSFYCNIFLHLTASFLHVFLSIPTTIISKPHATVATRLEGYLDASEFLILRYVLPEPHPLHTLLLPGPFARGKPHLRNHKLPD